MIRALGVVACAVALWAAPSAYAANGELAAVARGATDTLVTLNPDGSGLRALSTGPAGALSRPAWSPDGDRIAFAAGDAIDVYDLTTGAVTAVATGSDPAWTADGGRIELRRGTALLSVRPDGGDPVALGATLPAEATAASFSPDGTRVAYVLPSVLVFVERAAGGNPTLAASGVSGAPAWTPDSLRLALSAAGRIFSLVLAGPLAALTPAGGTDTAPAWSPDATQVVYLHAQGPSELRITASTGAGTRTVSRGVLDDPAWQPCTPGKTASCTSVAPPVCLPPPSVTTFAGVPVALPAPACTDPAHRPLTTTVVSGPAGGTLAGGVYSPAPGFTGQDAVVYRVSNGAVAAPLLRQLVFVVPPAAAPEPVVRRAPYLDALAVPRLVHARVVRLRAACDAPCTITLRLQVRLRGGTTKRSPRLRRALGAAQAVTLRLALAHKPKRRERIAWIVGTVRGAAGSRSVKLPVRLPKPRHT
jgi:Bacterial Ig domain/WD40-like Beta Propeller Repeat